MNGKAGVGEKFSIKAFDRAKKEVKSGKDVFEAKMVRVPARWMRIWASSFFHFFKTLSLFLFSPSFFGRSELDEPCEVECIIKNHKNGELRKRKQILLFFLMFFVFQIFCVLQLAKNWYVSCYV